MSEQKIFSGGIPVRPDVERLKKAISIEPGELIEHSVIEKVLGLNRKMNRYRTIISSWRKTIEREYLLRLDGEAGVGYRVLNPEQAVSRSAKDIDYITNQTRKAAVRVEMIDTTELPEQSKSQHSLIRRQAHLLNDAARQARKEIAAPLPTEAAAPRLVK